MTYPCHILLTAWRRCPPVLSAAFALSPGGRGQDGSPVITFPDYPAFSDVPDKEFQNVMTYLTSIPRYVSASLERFTHLPESPSSFAKGLGIRQIRRLWLRGVRGSA